MKKIALILAALLVAVSMSACDNGPGVDTPSPTKPRVPTKEETPLESEPDESDPEESETEPSASESEPESETKGEGAVELPRVDFP